MPDVVVVGGGIIGGACAYELAGRGLSVTLVERGELAAGASGRNHGLLLVPPDPALLPMFEASLALYREVSPTAPVPVGLDEDPIGFLVVAGEDEEERRAGKEEAEAAAASGVEIRRLEGAELHAAEPELAEELAEGWLLEDGRRLDPAALTVSLALLAAERGAEIRRHLTVRSLLLRGETVGGVVTDAGRIEADLVVLAAGPWSPGLLRPLGIHLPVMGARGWLVHLAPADPPVTRLVERAGWHVLGGEEEPFPASGLADAPPGPDAGTLLQPNRDGTLLVGGSRQRVITDEPEDPGVPGELVRRATRIAPSLAGAAVLGAWWGVRPMSPDGRPLVGWLADGLLVATGHGPQGVILGGGTARLVGSYAAGDEAPFDPGPFLPDRLAARSGPDV